MGIQRAREWVAVSLRDALAHGYVREFSEQSDVDVQTIMRSALRHMDDAVIIRAWRALPPADRDRLALPLFVAACQCGKLAFADHVHSTLGPFLEERYCVGGPRGEFAMNVYTFCFMRACTTGMLHVVKWLCGIEHLAPPERIKAMFNGMYGQEIVT